MNGGLNYKPQDVGYRMFFTKKDAYDEEVVPMRFARATNNRNNYNSDPLATDYIKHDFFAGPMHFGVNVKEQEGYKFFDVDLKTAYPSWLLNYARGNFKYKVGGTKQYYNRLDYFVHMEEGLRVYRIRFLVETSGRENSRIYRRWFLKTTKVKKLIMTDNIIAGEVSLPDIEDLVNRFLDEVQNYEIHDVNIDGIILAKGENNIYINEQNLIAAINIKNNKNNPESDKYKFILNSSTGYLVHIDKVMYYVMVNQIRLELFKLMDAIDRWNIKRPDLALEVVAANTDGLTIYAKDKGRYAINDILNYTVNNHSIFTFDLKREYDFSEAHFTPNDIRKVN